VLRRTCATVRGGFLLMFRGEVTGTEEFMCNCEGWFFVDVSG
jgi:hypothetical protein